jgi:hypothetical protein
MKIGARLASIAAACTVLFLVTAWVATGASAWTGLHDAGDVRISGAIGEITPEPLPPIVGAAGYDCGAGVFEVAVRNPNGADLAMTVELWLAADDGPRTPITKLDEAAHTLPAGSTAWLHVGADDPAAGLYRLKVDAPAVDASLWSGVVAIPAACETGDPPPAEPTDEPAETETPVVTEAATTETPAETPAVTETPAPTDESTGESGAESTGEPTAESTQEPAPEETTTPAEGG